MVSRVLSQFIAPLGLLASLAWVASCQAGDVKICVEARIDKKRARVFEPVRLDVVVRNIGTGRAATHVRSAHVMFGITLIGPSGEAVPRTAYGKMRVDLDSEGPCCSMELAAGESYTAEVPEFVRCFDLTKSGKYRLVVRCGFRDKSKESGFARFTSDEVLWEVVEEKDGRLQKPASQ